MLDPTKQMVLVTQRDAAPDVGIRDVTAEVESCEVGRTGVVPVSPLVRGSTRILIRTLGILVEIGVVEVGIDEAVVAEAVR